jgi:DNA-binding transcriptional MerR regulator
LLRAHHLRDGYRVFDVDQVLDLLRIDLLRSRGVGIKDISRLLEGEHTTLRSVIVLSPATDRPRLGRPYPPDPLMLIVIVFTMMGVVLDAVFATTTADESRSRADSQQRREG